MKPFHSFAMLAVIAAVGQAFAVDATTTPVGYVTLAIPANSDSTITPPLAAAPLYAGASTSISGNVVGATGLTSGAFVTTASYLRVTSGTLNGDFFPITANDGTTITVASGATTLQALGFASGDTFKVTPYWTLDTLFPGGAGVGGTADALNPTSFVFQADSAGTGANRASARVFFYCTGDVDNGLPAGWYDNSDPFSGPVGSTQIDPTLQYTIRSASSASSVVVSGEVPSTKLVADVVRAATTNDNYLGAPFPVDTTLQQSGLQSVVAATSDVTNPTEFIFLKNDTATGVNKAASAVYFYCSGDVDNGLPAGWYDNADPFAGAVTDPVLKAGRSIIVRKAPGSPAVLNWTAPLPYTL